MRTLTLLNADDFARCCPPDADEVGLGALKTSQGNLPLKLLDVAASISGLLATTRVRQTFVNTYASPLEATYIFPLPSRAAVSEYRFEVGERIIDGVLQERGQARRTYEQAISSGHRASITEEERPGVFTVRVGNILPGEEVSVHLTLSGPLPYSDGEATYRFPLVVAPRYIPGAPLSGSNVGDGVAHDTDATPDASRISPPVLLKGFPNPVQLSLTVDLDSGGLPLGAVRSSLHAVSTRKVEGGERIVLRPGERLNRDFILRFGLGAERLGSSLTLSPDAKGEGEGTFQLTVVPPLDQARTARPRDVVFVLDRSGSMGGWKMIAARRACARMLDTLTAQDRFGVLAFDTSIETPTLQRSGQLVAATDRNRFQAVQFLSQVEARGGTEMAQPLQRATDELLAGETAGRDRVLVLITDGQVGNEDQILRRLGKKLEQMRVFTLGIDRAVNEAFLRRLAGVGGGYCELVESEDRLDAVMDKIHRRIGTPLLTDVRIESLGEIEVIASSIAPARIPDMFAGTPLRISGRYRGRPGTAGRLRVSATDAEGQAWSEAIGGRSCGNAAHTACWARAHIRDLEDRLQTLRGSARSDLGSRITDISLRHQVLCRFTAFVAVDRAEVVNAGGENLQVTQAVDQPDGWGAADPFGNGTLSAAPGSARGGGRSRLTCAGFAASDPFAAPAPASAPMPVSKGSDAFSADLCFEASAPPPSSSYRSAPRVSRRRKTSPKKTKGIFARLGDSLFGSGETPSQTIPGGYRRRLKDLVRVLDTAGLLRVARELRVLIEDLRSVGTAPALLQPLEELQAALTTASPATEHALRERARTVLNAVSRGETPAPAATPGREGFWF